jgi:hypothetical protein
LCVSHSAGPLGACLHRMTGTLVGLRPPRPLGTTSTRLCVREPRVGATSAGRPPIYGTFKPASTWWLRVPDSQATCSLVQLRSFECVSSDARHAASAEV